MRLPLCWYVICLTEWFSQTLCKTLFDSPVWECETKNSAGVHERSRGAFALNPDLISRTILSLSRCIFVNPMTAYFSAVPYKNNARVRRLASSTSTRCCVSGCTWRPVGTLVNVRFRNVFQLFKVPVVIRPCDTKIPSPAPRSIRMPSETIPKHMDT